MIAATAPSACAIDDQTVWSEITRVARRMMREGRLDPADRPRVRTRLRGAGGADHVYELRAEPLLHAGEEGPVMMLAVERIGDAAAGPTTLEERFGLSPRQAEVASLLAERLTSKEIAARLGISRNTVRTHVEATMQRLGVHRRQEVRQVLEAGMQRDIEPRRAESA